MTQVEVEELLDAPAGEALQRILRPRALDDGMRAADFLDLLGGGADGAPAE